MTIQQLFNEVRDVLQDTDKTYWSDSELVDYVNGGYRAIAAERLEEPTTTSVSLVSGTNTYSVNGVLRYISATDSNSLDRELYPDDESGDDDTYGVIIQDYDRIYVNNPVTGVTLTIKNISLPSEINLSHDIRAGDESALKYFVLSRAYEKEIELENFQKSQYFYGLYLSALKVLLKSSRTKYVSGVMLTEGYYY